MDHMRAALVACRQGIEAGQTPFGACIVRGGEVLAVAHNRVWETSDVTAHAEVMAIREACRRLGAIDLGGATIFSTTEPCPMCFGAVHWARIERIVCAATIADARAFGFHELTITGREMKRMGGSAITLDEGLLRDESLALFRLWQARSDWRAY